MNDTKIEWCDKTLNPVIGCTFGCDFCYARKMNARFGWIDDFTKPKFFLDRLAKLDSKKPQIIFMDSMSDIADWKFEWVMNVFKAMEEHPQHTYLFLTKRPSVYNGLLQQHMPPNWWFGISLTTPIPISFEVHHSVNTFVSIEPIHADFEGLGIHVDWVIIGAETGNRKDKVIPKREWIDGIVEQCKIANVPVFMKNSLKALMGDDFVQEFPRGMRQADTN